MSLHKTRKNIDRTELDKLIRDGRREGYDAIELEHEGQLLVAQLPRGRLQMSSNTQPLPLKIIGRNTGEITLTPSDVTAKATLKKRMLPRVVRELVRNALQEKVQARILFVKRDGTPRRAEVIKFGEVESGNLIKFREKPDIAVHGNKPSIRSFDMRRVLAIELDDPPDPEEPDPDGSPLLV